ncbi:MAG TPA: glutaredoxin family protein [Candidatus Nanopelagicaceae bacterium]|nr:glutaredoxin family protein [Candidatus Nanopelagicaceae bacterium]
MKAERLELITRRNCPLCDLASAALAEVAAAQGLGISAFDVDDDPQLAREFTDRVPVVRYRGRVLAEGRTDAAHLVAALAALERTA